MRALFPDRRWVACAVASGVVSLALCLAAWEAWRSFFPADVQEPQSYAFLHPPAAEEFNDAAYLPEVDVPSSVVSGSPEIRLREWAPDQYELLYWGNPIRPAYTFRVQERGSRESVLLSSSGEVQKERPLPVPVSRRKDGRLPLQPAVKLKGLRGKPGELYAVRISVHDAASGALLCYRNCLLCGDEGR